ncbi:MAG: HD domain-containing protein [Methanobacteriaceae archaeon]
MKFIRDSVHGNLHLENFEVNIVDTPQVQRLRRIKQLGFTYLVYPGANHSRFEHSMGAMFLSSKLADNLDLDDDEKEIVRISAILHDVGHGPFSHVSEAVLDHSHEIFTSKIIKESQIADILSESFEPKEIIDVIRGKGPLGQIISGELDVDRMDYLLRDSHYTGVAYGVIDSERLLHNMKLKKNLVLDIKGVQAAESTLVARYFMYPSVYQHHTTRIVNSMFRRCLRKLFDNGDVNPEKIYKYDDADITSIARAKKGFVREIMSRLDDRDLFKNIFCLKLSEIDDPEEIFKITPKEIKDIENEISDDLNIPADYVIIDIPDYPSFDEMQTLVSVDNDIVKLSEISSIVGALNDARFNHADLCIYLPEEYSEKAHNISFVEYLNL